MLGTYRRALEIPGSWQFSATGFVARLPIAMVGLGIVLLVSGRTGSYAVAGILSASFQLPAALGAVATSRWIDRVGQARLLPWLAGANAALLIVFVLTVENDLPLVVQALVVAGAGVCQPAIGSMVRARWAHAATDARRRRSAFALESVIDELIFTVGPPVTAVLAIQFALPSPILVGAAIGLVGGVALAAQRSTQPPTSSHHDLPTGSSRRSAVLKPGAAVVALACVGIGAVFGSYEVSVVAFSQKQDAPGASGLVLGVWALGSMVGGLWFGARSWGLSLGRQMLLLPAIVAVALLPSVFAPTIPILVVVTAIGGASVAPMLIAAFSITERLVPAPQLTEGLTWTNSGLAIGFSVGTATGGYVVDTFGTSAGFGLAVAGGLFATAMGALGQRSFSRHVRPMEDDAPVPAWNDDPLPGPHPGGIVDEVP